jgi:nucleoside-diphosphate-sugar epimerase
MVTGCAGFIGSHLTESLLLDGIDVLGIDCFNSNYPRADKLLNLRRAREYDGFEFVPIDLSRGDLAELVADCDHVFHLAGEPGVRASWGRTFEPYLANNILATQQLLEAMRAFPDRRLVYASSSSVYGQAERMPTSELDLPAPFSPYGVTKLGAEQLCNLYHGNYEAQTVSLRYFSVYGPRQRPDMAFHKFCRAIADGDQIVVYGDGEQTRDFTYVGDVVAATRAAAEAGDAVGGVFNIGGGTRTSLNDTLRMLGEIAGRPLDVQRNPAQDGDVRDTGADTTRARAVLGWEPRVDLHDGLQAEFEWALEESPRWSAREPVAEVA